MTRPSTLTPFTRSAITFLSYRRAPDTQSHRAFCNRYLKPVFGAPDAHGNYALDIGTAPRIMFTAHHDSVDTGGGRQWINHDDGILSLPRKTKSACLGADCGAGMIVLLHMIRSGVPGKYRVFADEECGLIGSSRYADDNPDELRDVDAVVSFDRMGTGDVITHMAGGMRTCSSTFAGALSDALSRHRNLDYTPSARGSITDSFTFESSVPECTNISVGYVNQHTRSEALDLDHLADLCAAVVDVDWHSLPIRRDPCSLSFDDGVAAGSQTAAWPAPRSGDDYAAILSLVRSYPEAVADLLLDYGETPDNLAEAIFSASNGHLPDWVWDRF